MAASCILSLLRLTLSKLRFLAKTGVTSRCPGKYGWRRRPTGPASRLCRLLRRPERAPLSRTCQAAYVSSKSNDVGIIEGSFPHRRHFPPVFLAHRAAARPAMRGSVHADFARIWRPCAPAEPAPHHAPRSFLHPSVMRPPQRTFAAHNSDLRSKCRFGEQALLRACTPARA